MALSSDHSYLKDISKDAHALSEVIEDRFSQLKEKQGKGYQEIFATLPELRASNIDFSGPVVKIGTAKDLNEKANQTKLRDILEKFIPWRKGPFSLFGIDIKSEWQSDLKFDRVLPHINLKDKLVCDIGSNNGYYMFRAAHHQPALVWGIDPVLKYRYNFDLLQKYAQVDNLHFELLGYADLHYIKPIFDLVLCMGIIYHHRQPLAVLKACYDILKPGGQVIIETLGIGSAEPICLVPEKRYANMKNVWFVPSQSACANLLARSGFEKIECFYNEEMSENEQRSTPWAPFDSFAEFLHPKDKTKTKEGYERPHRIYLKAFKKF